MSFRKTIYHSNQFSPHSNGLVRTIGLRRNHLPVALPTFRLGRVNLKNIERDYVTCGVGIA